MYGELCSFIRLFAFNAIDLSCFAPLVDAFAFALKCSEMHPKAHKMCGLSSTAQTAGHNGRKIAIR